MRVLSTLDAAMGWGITMMVWAVAVGFWIGVVALAVFAWREFRKKS